MKRSHNILIVVIFIVAVLTVVFTVNRRSTKNKMSLSPDVEDRVNKVTAETNVSRNLDGVEKQADSGTSIVMRKIPAPKETQLRSLIENNLKSFFASRHSIGTKSGELWRREGVRIASVQESPDGTMILFYNSKKTGYEIHRYENGKLISLDIEIPNQDQGTRVNSWVWLGNDKLIGEHLVLIEPVPRGFGDEGWTKDIKFYVYDLKKRTHQEISFPGAPEFQPSHDKILKDEFDPSYSYVLPVTRYFSIKGITDEGAICLVSFDTSQPRGGNPKDEGWFILEDG